MTEAEWLACSAPDLMLTYLTAAASDRKLRLFACACCRHIWDLLPEGASRRAVEDSERFADGELSLEELQRSWSAARQLVAHDQARVGGWNRLTEAEMEARDTARSGAWSAAHSVVADSNHDDRHFQCDLLRDIFQPFHPLALQKLWLTDKVNALAGAIYTDRGFERMPALADGLADAGCTNAAILSHCRAAGLHVRGCWVVDLLTGRK
jgi:hypothetical protein